MSEPTVKPVPVQWHVPDELVSQVATNFVVQHTNQEFILTFFKLFPPIILGSPEEKKSQIEGMTQAKAQCVAQIVITPQRMNELIAVLQENLKVYLAKYGWPSPKKPPTPKAE